MPIASSVAGEDFGLATTAGFLTTSPERIDIESPSGAAVIDTAEITIAPFCFRPYEIEAVASDPWLLFENLDGIQVNGCGGDTTTFSLLFTPTLAQQCYQLLFKDAEFGGVLTSIPVRVPEPTTGLSLVIGSIGLVGIGGASRRRTRSRSRHDDRLRRDSGDGE